MEIMIEIIEIKDCGEEYDNGKRMFDIVKTGNAWLKRMSRRRITSYH